MFLHQKVGQTFASAGNILSPMAFEQSPADSSVVFPSFWTSKKKSAPVKRGAERKKIFYVDNENLVQYTDYRNGEPTNRRLPYKLFK